MKQKKAAISLSINFIVMLIIAIVVFGFSISFIGKLFKGSTKTQEAYDQQFDKQMESLACDSLDRVCVGKERKTLDKNNIAVFTMRILNVLGDDKTFTVLVACDSAISNCADAPSSSLAGSYAIENNEAQNFVIAFDGDGATSGTYVYNVNINPPSEYANEKQKLYVVVP